MEITIIEKCPLFAGIEQNNIRALLDCLAATKHRYEKDEFVFMSDDPAKFVGIVLSGGVNVIQEDFWGNRTILIHIEQCGIFAEAFSCAGVDKLPVSVVASAASEILLIDYKKIITVCSSTCVFHAQLISNMLQVLATKNIMLTRKMEHISQRTTREKLLSFLSELAVLSKSNDIIIPYNRQELADFLCVERSALSRELMQMKKDGLLDYDKSRFVLM